MFLFYKQIHPSFSADYATSILSRSTRKGGIPCMCSTVPPMSPILPSSSKIHCLSSSLRDHYRQSYDWSEHSDGCMALLFLRLLLYLCIIHHHSTLLEESGLELFFSFGNHYKCWLGIGLLRKLKLHYLKCDGRVLTFSFSMFLKLHRL